MNSEGTIMRSKTSFFHKGLSLNLLRRCWPLWVFWFVLLLFNFPIPARTLIEHWAGNVELLQKQLYFSVFEYCCTAAMLSVFAGILTVMAMFSFLYSDRTCGMVSSFPIRRETVFVTVFLTGLLPLLLAECLTALVASLMLKGWVSAALIGKWLRFAAMGTVAFYGFASFCAMLTGNLFVLPLVYFVLNTAAAVVEETVNELLRIFLYGYTESGLSLMAFSPVVQVLRLHPQTLDDLFVQKETVMIPNEKCLPVYCLAGIVFSVLALLLYRKRRMETAGDTVAIPILKPVFKTCMTFGSAFVAASFLTGEFFFDSLPAKGRAATALVLLLAGALIGYFAAEMMMQKTIHVFKGKWRGLLAAWAVLAVFAAACEFDVTGYETRLPPPDEIEQVAFGAYSSSVLEDRENIGALYALHESVIADKALHDIARGGRPFNVRYTLKDGREFARSYQLSMAEGQTADPASDVMRAQKLTNLPEAILSRHRTGMELVPDNIDRCRISVTVREGGRTYENPYPLYPSDLPPEQAYALYTEALLPDMEDGTIGCEYFLEELAEEKLSDTTVTIELRKKVDTGTSDGVAVNRYSASFEYLSFCVQMDSSRTRAWLRENTGLEIHPMNEAVKP